MAKGSWWNKKKRNKRNNLNSNQDENAESGLKYVINKKSLDNQETPASTSNYNNRSNGYNFKNSNIPNSFNFNNNNNNNSKHLRWNWNKPNYLNSAQNTNNNREEGTSEPKKPPNKAMTNRYFSIENKISEGSVNCSEECTPNVDENENSKENSGDNVEENDQESEQFIKKRDYLIKKLLQSRNLPEAPTSTSALKHVTSNLESATINSESEGDSSKKCNTENTPQSNETSKIINESSNVKAKAALTTPAFQDDFIPLFSSKKEKEKSPAPKEADQINDDEEDNYGEIVLESYDHDEKDEEDVVDLTDDNEIIEVFNTVKKGKQIVIFD
jgi:hypothetical protein